MDWFKDLFIDEVKPALNGRPSSSGSSGSNSGPCSWNDLKDKPFGEAEARAVLVPETTVEFTSSFLSLTTQGADFKTATLAVFDGVEYDVSSAIGGGGCGNSNIFANAGVPNDMPFAYYQMAPGMTQRINISADNLGTHTFALYGKAEKATKPLDEIYIPDTIARRSEVIPAPATAAVGQTIAVKVVDENNQPIEWEAVDMGEGGSGANTVSWNDLTDKPFGASYTFTECMTRTNVTFTNGSGGGSALMMTPIGVLTSGNTYFIEIDGEKYECVCELTAGLMGMSNANLNPVGDHGVKLTVTMGTSKTFTAPVADGTHEVAVYKLEESVTLLDETYIPDTIARKTELFPQPTTAIVGNVLIVESVDDNYKPIKYGTTRLQWDDIDNKPLGESLVNKICLTDSTGISNSVVQSSYSFKFSMGGFIPVNGRPYDAVLVFTPNNAAASITVAKGLVMCYINDQTYRLYGSDFEITSTDCYNWNVTVTAAIPLGDGTMAFSVTDSVKEVTCLPDRFIPETIARTSEVVPVPATASVGQTVVVKTVDENGKPTEWAAADMATGEAGSVEGTSMIIQSPNGTRFKITVSDDGILSAAQVSE